jgi:hypothetical protein
MNGKVGAMYRLCLIVIAALIVGGLSVKGVSATEAGDGSMDTLSAYLHGHRLPLVEARMITNDSAERTLMLYGFVATEYGKRDAEDQARDYLDDPDIQIVNRIKIRPALLTLGTQSSPAASTASAESAPPDALDDNAAEAAVQTQDFPDQIGDLQAYANQERDDEALMNNGISAGGIPLALVIIGSGAIFSPISPGPVYYNGFPPGVRPPIVFSSPPIVMRNSFNPPPYVARGFGPAFPSPFPAGPVPMFPATGGFPAFGGAPVSRGFGGFGASGFNHGGFGGGFGGFGGGFGGHR